MKESTVNALRKIQSLTAKVCQGCNHEGNKYRCCDKEFCEAVEKGLTAIGKDIPKTGHPDLQYMGEKGCVVPAEYRPGCSGYVCRQNMDRPTRREYDRLHTKFQNDPDVHKMMDAANNHLHKKIGGLK